MSSLYPEAYLLDYTYHFLVSWQKLCLLAVAQMLLLLGVVSRSPDACVRDDAKSVGIRAVLNMIRLWIGGMTDFDGFPPVSLRASTGCAAKSREPLS